MLKRWLNVGWVVASAMSLAAIAGSASAGQTVGLEGWVATWPNHYAVSGRKFELTYIQAIDIRRDGNFFSVTGGAPSWIGRWTQTIEVTPDGRLQHATCGGSECQSGSPTGYLASATLLALARAHRLRGNGEVRAFGTREVVCVPGEALGIVHPILDPCFDRRTGAVLAQWQRTSRRFDGPSLNPATVRVSLSGVEGASSTE